MDTRCEMYVSSVRIGIMVVSWVGEFLTQNLDRLVPSSTSQTIQPPLPYPEKPQNLDNTPLTRNKYHTMVIYGGNTTEILWEIHRKFIGNMTGNTTEILWEIPQLNKTDRRKNCGHMHTETTLKSRLFPWLSFGFSQGFPRANKGDLMEML